MPGGKPVKPPKAKEIPAGKSAHGIHWQDDFDWLQNKEDPDVLQYLKDENAYTDTYMAQFGDLVDCLYGELTGRIEESNVSAPYEDGGYIYQSRIRKGADYHQYYRRRKRNPDHWSVYFDAGKEARGQDYFDLAFLDVSPDGRLLAYAVDTDGSELYCLKFRDLQTGRDLDDQIPDVSGEGEWDSGSRSYFFVREDASRRPYQVHVHKLGNNPRAAKLVYEEKDPQFHIILLKSQDQKFLFACSSSKETTEVSFLDAADPGSGFVRIFARRTGIRYWIEHHTGSWLVQTNEDAPDYRLLRCPVEDPNLQAAEVLYPASRDLRLENVIPFQNHLVLVEREHGLDYIRIRNLTTKEDHRIATADPVYDIHPGVNAEFDTSCFTFVYSSPIRPRETIRYDMDDRTSKVIHSVRTPRGHDPDDYWAYRIESPSPDGTSVPVTIIHKKNFPRDGTRPMYLYAYGAYGCTVEACFRSSWLSFMERGFAVAIPHVRGGGLLGEHWYQSGKLGKKENTFMDFIAVAEDLIRLNYTRPGRILIEGDSAGGLLVGTVLNRRPDLFKAAVADVPFVDILNSMLDASLPLTTLEYEEWGDPADRETFEYIRSYSPYENAGRLPYPSILATAGYNDTRVPYWESAKWIANLRKYNTSNNPILLKTYLHSGHTGASGRYANLREIAFSQAFLISRVRESLDED